jgi:hypothetical protein
MHFVCERRGILRVIDFSGIGSIPCFRSIMHQFWPETMSTRVLVQVSGSLAVHRHSKGSIDSSFEARMIIKEPRVNLAESSYIED